MNAIIILILLSLCFISVPIIAANIGGWASYFGIFIVCVIWCILLLILRIEKWGEI